MLAPQVIEDWLKPAVYTFNLYKRGLVTAFGYSLDQIPVVFLVLDFEDLVLGRIFSTIQITKRIH